ncbi:MAG: hypothetical protein J0H18_02440 [Rhizobiales bacterium]|nr:hypothetical protein [Hyphomicrobiales bacterium]OJY06538.1 MAG: hypothetical protein BGP07_15850 [Rhizobiales bacterium 63-22]
MADNDDYTIDVSLDTRMAMTVDDGYIPKNGQKLPTSIVATARVTPPSSGGALDGLRVDFSFDVDTSATWSGAPGNGKQITRYTNAAGIASASIVSDTPTLGSVIAILVVSDDDKIDGDSNPDFVFVGPQTARFDSDDLTLVTWNAFSSEQADRRYPVMVSTKVVNYNSKPLQKEVQFRFDEQDPYAYFFDDDQVAYDGNDTSLVVDSDQHGMASAIVFAKGAEQVKVHAVLPRDDIFDEKSTHKAPILYANTPELTVGLSQASVPADGVTENIATVTITSIRGGQPVQIDNVRLVLTLEDDPASVFTRVVSGGTVVSGLNTNCMIVLYKKAQDPDNKGLRVAIAGRRITAIGTLTVTAPLQDTRQWADAIGGQVPAVTARTAYAFGPAWWGLTALQVSFYGAGDNQASAYIFRNGLHQAAVRIMMTLLDRQGVPLTGDNQPTIDEVMRLTELCNFVDGTVFGGDDPTFANVLATYAPNEFEKQIDTSSMTSMADAGEGNYIRNGVAAFTAYVSVKPDFGYRTLRIGQIFSPGDYPDAPVIENTVDASGEFQVPLALTLNTAPVITVKATHSNGLSQMIGVQNDQGLANPATGGAMAVPDHVDNYWRHWIFTITLNPALLGDAGNRLFRCDIAAGSFLRDDHCVAWRSSVNGMYQSKLYLWPQPPLRGADGQPLPTVDIYPISGLWALSGNGCFRAAGNTGDGRLVVSLFSVFNGTRTVPDLLNNVVNLTIYDQYGNSGPFSFKKSQIPRLYKEITQEWNPLNDGFESDNDPHGNNNDYGFVDYTRAIDAGPYNDLNPYDPQRWPAVNTEAGRDAPDADNATACMIVAQFGNDKAGQVMAAGTRHNSFGASNDPYWDMVLSDTGGNASRLTLNYSSNVQPAGITVNSLWYYITQGSGTAGKPYLYLPVQAGLWQFDFGGTQDSGNYLADKDFAFSHSQTYLTPVWERNTFLIFSVWFSDDDSVPLAVTCDDGQVITRKYVRGDQNFEWDILR